LKNTQKFRYSKENLVYTVIIWKEEDGPEIIARMKEIIRRR